MKNEIQHKYAAIIVAKIQELFDESIDSDLKIDFEELKKGENPSIFIHALSNLVPCLLFNKLTGKNLDILEFNHFANFLVMKYGEVSEED